MNQRKLSMTKAEIRSFFRKYKLWGKAEVLVVSSLEKESRRQGVRTAFLYTIRFNELGEVQWLLGK